VNYASIFKDLNNQWRLVIHREPGLSGDSVIQEMLFDCKARAKNWASDLGCKAWNY
jgi:hypothetical protein